MKYSGSAVSHLKFKVFLMALLVSAPGKEKKDGGFGKDGLHKIQYKSV